MSRYTDDLISRLRYQDVRGLGSTGDPTADKLLTLIAGLFNEAADELERLKRLDATGGEGA